MDIGKLGKSMTNEDGNGAEATPVAAGKTRVVSASAEVGTYAMPASSVVGGKVVLGQEIEIDPAQTVDAMSTVDARAFSALDNRAPGNAHVALMCRNSRVPRVTCIGAYKNVKNANMLKLRDAGVVYWPLEKRQRLALVFDMPTGRRMLDPHAPAPVSLREDQIISTLIMPVVSALMELRAAGMVHGAICLENMFLTGVEGAETVILGECLSSAPFTRLHPVYCPIARAMAQPSGRGAATEREDLYALGMCVAMLARKTNLMHGQNAQAVVMDKIAQGSFLYATGGARMHGGLSEFLRGVLNDDPRQRWDLDEASRWVEGRRIPAKAQNLQIKAARPFIFRDEKYWDLRSLAFAFSQNVQEAAAVLEKDHVDLWAKRNFDDMALNGRLEKARAQEKGSTREKLVSSVCMALDPQAPLRYREVAVLPDGFGTALAQAISRDGELQSYAEIISQQMMHNWILQEFEEMDDAAGHIAQFERCRNYLVQKMPVYGIERVLYALNKEVCCLSPSLRDYVVLNPGSLLLALEDIARRNDRPHDVLDRHMMAFISVREPKMIDPHLGHVVSHDRGYQIVGIARTLAAIQRRFATGPVPGVGNWLISLIKPAADKLNDRDLRQEVMRKMGKLSDSGNLAAVLDLIDNQQIARDDMHRFSLARNEYLHISRERAALEAQLRGRQTFGRATGRQVAMIVSLLTASCGILGFLFMQLMQGGFNG